MITFENVSKSFRTTSSRKVVLDNATFSLEPGYSLGVLGGNGAGKSTLIRMLAGVEMPDRGRIRRNGRISFPLGFSGTFHPQLSGKENVKFLARLYGEDTRKVYQYVIDFSDLGDYMSMPVMTYSSGMLAKLAFGTCLAIDFDLYLIDEVIAVGDARFQERCQAAFASRMSSSDVVIVSHSMHTIRSWCDRGAVLSGGRFQLFDRIDDAIKLHNSKMIHREFSFNSEDRT